ncbi:MAG: flavin reductase [Bacteroidia bacterium]|nr:flavin reductase [Bacteroidia bacterium]
MYLSNQDIESLPRIRRINIINSISGIKPANLVGTQCDEGLANLAIFSSVVHLGSDPALIGCVFRSQHSRTQDTYRNIKASGVYTINQVPAELMENAHFTSAKFEREVSEFDRCGFNKEYHFDFPAPFVKESRLKLGLEMIEEIPIQSNGTILMIGRIMHLIFPDDMMDAEGNLNLEVIDGIGIGGVNTYYSLRKVDQFPYAHKETVPKL